MSINKCIKADRWHCDTAQLHTVSQVFKDGLLYVCRPDIENGNEKKKLEVVKSLTATKFISPLINHGSPIHITCSFLIHHILTQNMGKVFESTLLARQVPVLHVAPVTPCWSPAVQLLLLHFPLCPSLTFLWKSLAFQFRWIFSEHGIN